MRRSLLVVTAKAVVSSALVIAITLAPLGAHADPAPRTPTEQASTGSQMRTAGWVMMGGGAAAVSAGLVMFRLEYVNAHETDEPPNVKDDKAKTYHTAGQVLLWAGVVGLGTGASLVLFAPKDKAAPQVSVGLGHVAVRGSF